MENRFFNWFLCKANPQKDWYMSVPRANWGNISNMKIKTGYNQDAEMYYVLITDKRHGGTFRINMTAEHYQNFFGIAAITNKFSEADKQREKAVLYKDVQTIQCFCWKCGKDMGSVDYFKMNGSYPLHIPLCYECWKLTGWEMVQPNR